MEHSPFQHNENTLSTSIVSKIVLKQSEFYHEQEFSLKSVCYQIDEFSLESKTNMLKIRAPRGTKTRESASPTHQTVANKS